jgi:hypothetical protein
MRDGCPTVLEFQTSGSELLGAGPEGNVASKEIEVADESPTALQTTLDAHTEYLNVSAHIFHEDANGVRGSIVWVRHDEIAVLETCRLCYLPVQACRDIYLATIIVRVIHSPEIEDDVPDLAVELILADVPLSAIATRDIDIGIDQRNALEVWQPPQSWSVVWVSDKLGVVES